MNMERHLQRGPVGERRYRRVLVASLTALALTACGSTEVIKKERQEKAEFHHKLALGYFHAKNIDLAIRELVKSFEFDGDHPDSQYLYGFILFGRKQYEEAAASFRKVLKRRPGFFAARNHLGVTYLELERWSDAIIVLKPLLKEPSYTTPYLAQNNIGWAYLKQSNLRLAEKHLRMAVFVNPKFCQGYRNLGLLAMDQRDLDGALEHFSSAVTRCPKVAEFHFQKGEVLAASNRTKKAEVSFRTCRKLAGDSLLGRRCEARMISGGGGGVRGIIPALSTWQGEAYEQASP